jgi:hypothetical protein
LALSQQFRIALMTSRCVGGIRFLGTRMTNKLNLYIVLSISAGLIVFVGILGYKYILQNFLHNKFATWEMASISMSIFINFLVSQRCKEWMLPYIITGDQLRPWKKLRGKFFSALILLGIVLFMILFHNYLRTFFDQKWPNLIGGGCFNSNPTIYCSISFVFIFDD